MMSPEVLASIIVAVLSVGGSMYAARSARRSPRQESRDDFTAFATELRADLRDVKADLAAQKQEAADQRRRLAGQDFAIRYLVGWIRGLVGYIRSQKLEPPAPPQPMPPEIQQYLLDIGV